MKLPLARALGRLIGALEVGATNDVVGSALAAALRLLRPRSAEVRCDDTSLSVDDISVDDASSAEVAAFAESLRRHGVAGVTFRMGITAKELLQGAAILAVRDAEPSHPSVFDAARRLGFWHLTFHGADQSTPVASAAPMEEPAPIALDSRETAEREAAALAAECDRAVNEGKSYPCALLLLRALRTEEALHSAADVDGSEQQSILRSFWGAQMEHLFTAPVLRLVAGLVTTRVLPREWAIAILRRAGNDGAAALMECLSAAASTMDRRELFDAIVEAGVGVPVLAAHLAHRQWFVARNAACLLGAMRATEAEPALVNALSHSDERVRTSIATALAQLDTASGRRALERAIRDSSSDVRRRALSALLNGEVVARSAAVLSEALDLERDPEVQLEVIAGLRALGTPYAVQQLVRLCSPSSARSTECRRAALEALTHLRPTAAAPLLRIHAQDRDPETRAHATALLASINRAA